MCTKVNIKTPKLECPLCFEYLTTEIGSVQTEGQPNVKLQISLSGGHRFMVIYQGGEGGVSMLLEEGWFQTFILGKCRVRCSVYNNV